MNCLEQCEADILKLHEGLDMECQKLFKSNKKIWPKLKVDYFLDFLFIL